MREDAAAAKLRKATKIERDANGGEERERQQQREVGISFLGPPRRVALESVGTVAHDACSRCRVKSAAFGTELPAKEFVKIYRV